MFWHFTRKYYGTIEAPYFVTIVKPISYDRDVFVSMTASHSSQSWELSLWGFLLCLVDCSVTCLWCCSVLTVCAPTLPPSFQSNSSWLLTSLHWSLTELTAHFLFENRFKYVLCPMPYLEKQVYYSASHAIWTACCLSTNLTQRYLIFFIVFPVKLGCFNLSDTTCPIYSKFTLISWKGLSFGMHCKF